MEMELGWKGNKNVEVFQCARADTFICKSMCCFDLLSSSCARFLP